MKRIILVTGMLILQFACKLSGQSCQVLQPNIIGTYAGECKKGLADGNGEATGVDFYKGEFRKGYPDGVGTYIWHTGETYVGDWKHGLRDGKGKYTYKIMGKDTDLVGEWKNDKFIGNLATVPYSIEYKNTISRITCIKVGKRPYIKYKFAGAGTSGETNNINNLLLQGSSGTESNTTSFTGFEQVIFPFQGKVTFSAPNAFMTGTLQCELRFTINEPGSWIITMFY